MKQSIRLFHDIVFGKACHFFSSILFGVLKSIANYFFAARAADEFKTLNHFIRLLVFYSRIKVFFIFPDNDNVHIGVFGLYERM